MFEEIKNEFGENPYTYFKETDLAILIEIATKIRYEN